MSQFSETRAFGDAIRALLPVNVNVTGTYEVKVSVGGVPVNGLALTGMLAAAVDEEVASAEPPLFRLPRWKIESLYTASELGQTFDWGLLEYGLPDVFKLHRGKGVKVAILDTGVQEDHPDLAGQILDSRNFTNSQGTFDIAGHGTHCAGIVAAVDNAQGVIGVAPDCQLLIGKVLGDDGSGYGDWIAAGLDWAAASGADVISMSLGSPYPDNVIRDGIRRAVAKGCLVICAAGNSGPNNPTDIDYPGRFAEVVAVAAVMQGGAISKFSSRGPSVAFAAPGQNILSTFPTSRYARLSGTSMATPFLAGVAALFLGSQGKRYGRDAFVDALKAHAIDAGAKDRDTEYGWGIVDVGSLFKPAPVVPPPVPPPDSGYDLGAGFKLHIPAVAGDAFSIGRG